MSNYPLMTDSQMDYINEDRYIKKDYKVKIELNLSLYLRDSDIDNLTDDEIMQLLKEEYSNELSGISDDNIELL